MTTDKEKTKQVKSAPQHLLHYINLIEDGLLVSLLTGMIIIACIQILLRNVWDTGFAWGDPLLRILVLWIGLLGAMVATRKDNHISIDILTRYLSARSRRISSIVSDGFSLCICMLLSYHAGRFVLQDQDAGILAFSNIPAWWFELIIPLGFAVMSLRYALRCAAVLRGQT